MSMSAMNTNAVDTTIGIHNAESPTMIAASRKRAGVQATSGMRAMRCFRIVQHRVALRSREIWRVMKSIAPVALTLTFVTPAAWAQVNAGTLSSEKDLPFAMTQVATFNMPWRIAFLPDGRMLITEKVGPLWLVTQQGAKTSVANVPPVLYGGQGGMLGVYLSPNYAADHNVYLTYSEPGDSGTGSSLALARARLAIRSDSASLEGLQVIWRDGARGRGGQ